MRPRPSTPFVIEVYWPTLPGLSTVVTVARLFNAGIFRGGALLVGSHAFGALMNELGATVPFPMTEDVDIARAGRIEVAALPKDGFLGLLRETGLPFHEVPQLKRAAPPTMLPSCRRK